MKVLVIILVLILVGNSHCIAQFPTIAVPPDPGLNIADTHTNTFKVYPNPSTGKATIDLSDFRGKDFFIRIFDLNGRVVFSKARTKSRQLAVDLPRTSGMSFTMTVTNEKGFKLSKLLYMQ